MRKMDERYVIVPTRVTKKRRRVGVVTNMEVIHRGTGEIREGVGYLTEEYTVDASPFVKVYNGAKIAGLSEGAIKLLIFLSMEMKYDNSVVFDVLDAVKFIGKSKRTFYYALDELLNEDVIRHSGIGEYTINPNILCKGTRSITKE